MQKTYLARINGRAPRGLVTRMKKGVELDDGIAKAAAGLTSIEELAACQGELIGRSDWVTITQEAVNLFADATGDHQWIHVDPERAASGPFGTTIAHGYMTLAMLPPRL